MMDLGDACPHLLSRCHPNSYSLGEFAAKAHAFVHELQPLHPLFTGLRLVGKNAKDSPTLASDLSNLQAWIYQRSWERRPPTGSEYSDLGTDGKPTQNSHGEMGFRLGLSNLKSWDERIDLDLHTAMSWHSGRCNFILPRKNRPEFMQQPLMGDLLELVVRHWPVHYASVASGGWHNTVNWAWSPDGRLVDPVNRIEIGWLTYIDDPSVAQVLPPQVKRDALGPGVVFELTEHFSSYEDADDVAWGRHVRNMLLAAGRLRPTEIVKETDASLR
jgi:hypothetical protein